MSLILRKSIHMPHCWVHHGPVCFVCGSIFEFRNFQNPLIFPCSHASDQHGQSSEAARKLSLGVAWGMINSRNYGNQLQIIFPFNIELDKMNDFGSCDCKNPSTALKYHETPSFASDRYVTLLVVLWSKMPCSMHPFLWHLITSASLPRSSLARWTPACATFSTFTITVCPTSETPNRHGQITPAWIPDRKGFSNVFCVRTACGKSGTAGSKTYLCVPILEPQLPSSRKC